MAFKLPQHPICLATSGWDASEKVEIKDYSQFNSEKKFTTEEADERCKRQGIVCDQNK